MQTIRRFSHFVTASVRIVLRGNQAYWAWLTFLGVLIVSGALAYARQATTGLVLTAMRDQVSWGFYIGNFTFLVGVAAAAVVLVIPAYIYDWKPIREIVIFGELLALSAIIMCLLFVLVDIGRPDRLWHLDSAVGLHQLPQLDPGLGCHRAQSLFPRELRRRDAHHLPRIPRPALREAPCHPACARLDSDGDRDSHRDRVSVQRYGRTPLLEFLDPRAAVPGVGVLFRSGDSARRAPVAAPVHTVRDPEPGHLENRGTDGLRDVPQSVPARRRSLQGVLLEYRAPALYAVLVSGDRPHTGLSCRLPGPLWR